MYFYILDGSHKPTLAIAHRLKRELGNQGIAGEIARTDSSQSASTLADLGRAKGYTTIVSVGPDRHTNAVAHALIKTDAAFGLIPTDLHSRYHPLLGITGWQEAIPVLRHRSIEQVTVGITDQGDIFLEQIQIYNPKAGIIRLTLPTFVAELNSQQLVITNGGLSPERQQGLIVQSIEPSGGMMQSLKKLINLNIELIPTSLATQTIGLTGNPSLHVTFDGIAGPTLPLVLRTLNKALRVIVPRTTASLNNQLDTTISWSVDTQVNS